MSTAARRILVVDDEPLLLRLLSTMLSAEGFDVTLAHNGQEALQLVESNEYALVVTDVRMPTLSGPEFAKRMRYTNAPKLLFMSGASSEPLNELLRTGASFIKKPFRSNELLKVVTKLLGS